MKKSLIIWVPSYSSFDTMKFEDVKDFSEFTTHIDFSYSGMSTTERRNATFSCDKIIGWAITSEAQHD